MSLLSQVCCDVLISKGMYEQLDTFRGIFFCSYIFYFPCDVFIFTTRAQSPNDIPTKTQYTNWRIQQHFSLLKEIPSRYLPKVSFEKSSIKAIADDVATTMVSHISQSRIFRRLQLVLHMQSPHCQPTSTTENPSNQVSLSRLVFSVSRPPRKRFASIHPQNEPRGYRSLKSDKSRQWGGGEFQSRSVAFRSEHDDTPEMR